MVDAVALAADAVMLVVAVETAVAVEAVVVVTVLVTGEAVLAAAGKLSRCRNSQHYVFILHSKLTPAGSSPTAMVRMLVASGCSFRPSGWL